MSANPISCVVGLGNPGANYAQTRHNVGFWLVDALAEHYGVALRSDNKFAGEVTRLRSEAGECWLLKPTTFMNRSGRSVAALARFYKLVPEQLLVVHDDLDLAPGVVRLKKGGGHGGHNGLRDIAAALGSNAFFRARIGIGHPGHRDAVTDYVLSRPGRTDQEAIEQALATLLAHWKTVQQGDMAQAMQALHSAT
jgi:peptidyl-tRNA hydrolase, PTH1 family